MCSADTTPYLIEVGKDGAKSQVSRTDALYYCRNFDRLQEWADANIVLPYNNTEEIIKHRNDHVDHVSSS